MTNKELLYKYLKENGSFATTKEMEIFGVNRQTISVARNNGELIRVKRGLYKFNEFDEDPYFEICANNNVIISNESALFLYGLTDRLPNKITITVLQGSGSNALKDFNLKKYYSNPNIFDLGKTKIKSPFGNMIPVYDVDRTFVDLIKNQNKIDNQIFNQGIKNYFKLKSKSIYSALNYAKLLRTEKKVKAIINLMMDE